MSTYESCFDLVPQGGLSLEEAQAIFAVIEAAEALVANREMLEGFRFPFAFHKLIHAQREAVEALREARDE